MLKRLPVICLTLLVAMPVLGQEVPPPWRPSAPEGLPDDFDWLRLPSHEWLKGELISMYDEKLEFDSDELGMLEFDWDDVRELRTSRVVQVGRENAEPLGGRLRVDGDDATVFSSGQEIDFARREILTIIAGEAREINLWSMKVSLGGNFRSGNTDQIEYSARATAARRSVRNRLGLEYIGNMSSLDSVENSNNARFNAGWDHFMSRRLFVRVAALEWYRDPFKNLSSQTSFTAGIGYELVDTARTTWSVSGGPAYQVTSFSSVEPGEDDSVETAALTASTVLEVDLTNDIDMDASYKATFTSSEAGRYTHHLVVGLDFELTSRLDFNVSWVWDRTEKPTADKDGVIPEKDDFRVSVGLGWEF